MIPDKPASLPKAPDMTATSPMAPPMATRPRPISSQLYCVNSLNALAISPRDCTVMKMEPLPRIPENPASFPRAPVTSPISPRAPPMAVRPRPISPQSYCVKEPNADAMSPRLCAVIRIDPPPMMPEKPASFPRAPVTSPTSPRAPPMATRPRPISPQSYCVKEPNADAMSPRDLAVMTMLTAAEMLCLPNRPSRPVTVPISVRAPPMADRPLPI